ncbi:RDD family protein [Pseudooceanicola sp. CBS1P-1]|uniref:RDD family protein n=1 Tax=Pseudooceanicola albus TaxID=2692189 RepID=A0A6L7G0D7_9RHOB|nr:MULTISPECIES: RDD family protein [Pseudooceanicola]MBT9382397.1 RDD family protein [Pseudooceanicola endophyticus]MXN16938.1 RDD family protein [Pseudooceanicola albus]
MYRPDPDFRDIPRDPPAEWTAGTAPRRALAWALDSVLVLAITLLVLPFTAFTGLLFFPALMLGVGFLYRLFTIAAGSGTWGMRLLGIELRSLDGARLTGEQAFLHTLAYTICWAIPVLQVISVIMMAATPHGQGLGDHILGTTAMNRRLR